MSDSQPYDHSFKVLADTDPRATLAAFAGIPLHADVDVTVANGELSLPSLRVDHLYLCRKDGEESLVHFEAVTRYRADTLERQANYVRAIAAKYGLPCRSYLLLLTPGGVPETFPVFWERSVGDYRSRVRLRPVRLWTIPAKRILRLNRVAILPWTALMRADEEDLQEAMRRIAQADNARELLGEMMVLLGLRYGRKGLFKEKFAHMVITEEMLKESYFYELVMEKGLEKGERVGLGKGEKVGIEKGERQLLDRLLNARFGAIPDWARERIADADVETIERWAVQTLSAPTLEDCLA